MLSRLAAALLAMTLGGAPALADTVTIFTIDAVKPALAELGRSFEASSGHHVNILTDSTSAFMGRIEAGEKADVILLSAQAVEQLEAKKKFKSFEVGDIGRAGIGLAVRANAPIPSLLSERELKAALDAAGSIAYADPARGDRAGSTFHQALVKLGLVDKLAGKLHMFPSSLEALNAVAAGEMALGVAPVIEISGRQDVALAGPLPSPLQHWTVYRAVRTDDRSAARAFFDYIADDQNIKVFQRFGLEP